jgi:hypothetical protein
MFALVDLPGALASSIPVTSIQVRERVAVAEFQSPPRFAGQAGQARNDVLKALRKYASMEVLSSEAWQHALETVRAPRPGCAGEECLTVAAQLLHADTLVTGSLQKGRDDWVLTLGVTTPSSGSPAKASLHLQQPKHIAANARRCLDRLLAIWPQNASPREEPVPDTNAAASAAEAGIVRIPTLDRRRDHSKAGSGPATAPATRGTTTRTPVRSSAT